MLARTGATATRHPQTGPTTATTDTDTKVAPTFELSVRQLLASVAAAVTAAILGSRLGVAGTLIGAALASSVTMVASAVYSHSLAAAQYRLHQARGHQDDQDAATTVIPVQQQAWGLAPQPVTRVQPAPSMPTEVRAERRLPRWAVAGLGAIAACALALLTVTGIEAVRGTPLSGGDSGGLSVLGGNSAGTPDGSPVEDDPIAPAVISSSESTPADTSSTTVTSTTTVTATDPTTDTSTSTTSDATSTSATTSTTSSPPPTSSSSPTTADSSAGSAETSVESTTASRVGGP